MYTAIISRKKHCIQRLAWNDARGCVFLRTETLSGRVFYTIAPPDAQPDKKEARKANLVDGQWFYVNIKREGYSNCVVCHFHNRILYRDPISISQAPDILSNACA